MSEAVKQYVTWYTVQQRNDIVDTTRAVTNETLRVVDLNDVPRIAEKVGELNADMREEIQDSLEKSSSEISQLV